MNIAALKTELADEAYAGMSDAEAAAALIATSTSTIIDRPILLARDHAWMDDAPEYHQMAMQVAGLPS